MANLKTSLIITVLNEAEQIELLLSSILEQHLPPTEVVIADGGSSDQTVELIKTYLGLGNRQKGEEKAGVWEITNSGIKFKILVKTGNRSVGRNFAISHASYEWLALTDAGCILHKNWLRELLRAVESGSESGAGTKASGGPDVVAGYYDADPMTPFEEAVVPYVLVMPDRVDPKNFLPATRSMLIKKSVFLENGGFDETLADNEDYALARKLQAAGVRFGFARKAVVTWIPRRTWSEFWTMIYRFARGDVFAGILRPKVLAIFARYFVLLGIFLLNESLAMAALLVYGWWAFKKNQKYVPNGAYFLPLLQVYADFAVMAGSVAGLVKRLRSGQGKARPRS